MTPPPPPPPLPRVEADDSVFQTALSALFSLVWSVLKNKRVWCYGIFWGWNLVFLAFLIFGIFPFFFVSLVGETIRGTVPWSFTGYLFGLILVSFVSLWFGLTIFLRQPERLFCYFFGIEAPLFLFFLFRLFFLREISDGLVWFFCFALFGMAAYFIELARRPEIKPSLGSDLFQIVAKTVLVGIGFVSAAFLAFYALPFGWAFLKEFFIFGWLKNVVWYFSFGRPESLAIFLFGGPLLAMSVAAFVALPVSLVLLYTSSWLANVRRVRSVLGPVIPWALACGIALPFWGVFSALERQPQIEAFAWLESPPKDGEARRFLLEKSPLIRRGLLNAYLAGYRYLSPVKENNHITEIYKRNFGLSHTAASDIQRLYNVFASPFLYQGNTFFQDREKAERLYEAFFDQPIQKAERVAILRAVSSSIDQRVRESGLLDVGQRRVRLTHQEISLRPFGDWAEIEIHEVYKNQTFREQEILYYFSLPESSVVTGLWLGDSDDKSKAFRYTIAPRGAAQRVYRAQVARRVDPALLEQLGPRQYRLRAFPIPPKQVRYERSSLSSIRVEKSPPFHLWLTIRVFRQKGVWPLPRLAEKRNVFWDHTTIRTAGGELQPTFEGWLPSSVPKSRSVSIQQTSQIPIASSLSPSPSASTSTPAGGLVVLADGTKLAVHRLSKGLLPLPKGRRFALVIDRSRSMDASHAELVKEIRWLQKEIAPSNQVSLFLTSAKTRGEAPFFLPDIRDLKPEYLQYFGGMTCGELLTQFQHSRRGAVEDAVLLLTDGSCDQLETKVGNFRSLLQKPKAPTSKATSFWMHHLGSSLPKSYEDGTLAVLQTSGGGTSTDLQETFERIEFQLSKSDPAALRVVDGYRWRLVSTPPPASKPAERPQPPSSPHLSSAPSSQFSRPLRVARGTARQVSRGVESPQPLVSRIAEAPQSPASLLPVSRLPPSKPTIYDLSAFGAQQWILASLRASANDHPTTLDRLHQIAVEHSIVSPYSSMLVLVNREQEEELRRASSQADRFKRDVESGKVNLPSNSNPFQVHGTPEPHEWFLLGLVLLALFVLDRRRLSA